MFSLVYANPSRRSQEVGCDIPNVLDCPCNGMGTGGFFGGRGWKTGWKWEKGDERKETRRPAPLSGSDAEGGPAESKKGRVDSRPLFAADCQDFLERSITRRGR